MIPVHASSALNYLEEWGSAKVLIAEWCFVMNIVPSTYSIHCEFTFLPRACPRHLTPKQGTLMLRKGTTISTENVMSCSQLRIVTYMRFFSLPWLFSFAVFPRKQHVIWSMETRLPQFSLYIKWSSQQLWFRAAFLLVKSWLSSILFSGEQKFFDPRAERPLPRISSTLPLHQVLSLLLETLNRGINCPWARSCLWLVSRGSEWNTFTWH